MCPSAVRARCSGSIVRRSVRHPQGRDDEERLIADIIELAKQYGRYGYRKIAELLRTTAGWVVNDKRVERIWRLEGLKVPAKQPKRGRLWLADGSCIRLRPMHCNHVWSYDFVEHRTHDGRKYRMLNVIDEFTRECLAIQPRRHRWSLFDLFAPPERLDRLQQMDRLERRDATPRTAKPRKKIRKAAPAEPEAAIVEKAPDARTVLVVGDFIAGGLAEGLTAVFAGDARVRVLDRTRASSGFVRSDVYDWPAEIDDLIATEKPAAVVIMLGSNDRQQMKIGEIREPAFSPAWLQEYGARADAMATGLSAGKAPFFWVGMPAFKSSKMSSDMIALNEAYKAAALKSGGEFIDIWDGFVDENGAFAATGPDINGQPVRLRATDGINMTRPGKRKMAFYLEKPLNKILGIGAPVATSELNQLVAPDGGGGLPAIDRTAPISLMDPDLDGGSELLGATVETAKRSGGIAPIGGVAPAAQAGRADDFAFGVIKPVVPAEETTAASR